MSRCVAGNSFSPPGASSVPNKRVRNCSAESAPLDSTPTDRCGSRIRKPEEIRVFDPDSGAHLFTIGGRGDGPGEFRQSRFLGFDGEGNAFLYDHEHRRLSVFSGSGEFQRSHLLPSSLGISPLPLHVTRTGTLFGQIPQMMERRPVDGSILRDTVRIWTMPVDGTAPTLVSMTLGALWYFRDGRQVTVPFASGSRPGFGDDRVYVIDGVGEASYSVYGPAGLERRVEIDRPRRQIDDRSVTKFLEDRRGGRYPESLLRIYEEHVSDMPIPEARRYWDGLVFSDQGDAWLLRASDAVAAARCRFLRTVKSGMYSTPREASLAIRDCPPYVSLVEVSGQSALTIVRDEMGRATVAIHDVRWIG